MMVDITIVKWFIKHLTIVGVHLLFALAACDVSLFLPAVGPCADLCLESHAGQGMDLLPGALQKGGQYGSHDGYKDA